MLQHRLSRNSTIIATQEGLGIIERFYQINFPDPRDRPTLRVAHLALPIHDDKSMTVTSAAWAPKIDRRRSEDVLYACSLRDQHDGRGYNFEFLPRTRDPGPRIEIGPVAVSENDQLSTPQRKAASKYIINLLESNPLFPAGEVDHDKLLFMRLKKLAIRSVVEPMCVLQQCRYGELFKDPENVKIAVGLTAELLEVCKAILRTRLEFEVLWSYIYDFTQLIPGHIAPMLIHVNDGMSRFFVVACS